MTGMPTWDGIMSDEEIWKVIAFIKHSNALPPETAAAWQKLAAEPTTIRARPNSTSTASTTITEQRQRVGDDDSVGPSVKRMCTKSRVKRSKPATKS